jgi:hypothetical protein
MEEHPFIVAVTGHRDVVPAMSDVIHAAVLSLTEVHDARMLVGMAVGVDTMVAEACVALRIPWTACIPHPYYAQHYASTGKLNLPRFNELVDLAMKVVYVVPESKAWHWKHNFARNEYMARWASEVWAFSDILTLAHFADGRRPSGGTAHMISTSLKLHRVVRIRTSTGTEEVSNA